MLLKRVMPLILFKDWKMVKTTNFSNAVNYGSPVGAVKVYGTGSADEIIYLDIQASLEKKGPNYEAVEDIVGECFVPLTVGGGIRTPEDIRKLLRVGADKVSINSAIVDNPLLVKEAAKIFGSQCIVASIDVKRVGDSYEVFTLSGTRATGLNAFDWAVRVEQFGAGEILINSIDNDGVMKGYDLELLKGITDRVSIPVVAAGGAGHPQHLVDAIVIGKVEAVAVASLFLFTEYGPVATKRYLREQNIDVRPC